MDSLVADIKVDGGAVTGTCDIAKLPGKCTFANGTGSLAPFALAVVVTQTPDGTWDWDGTLGP